jgi:predicted GTPase
LIFTPEGISMGGENSRIRVLIMGAAGRDFHNFNMAYRDNDNYEVVAFTGAQIPGIDRRRYPPQLAGRLYPQGIEIAAEEDLSALCRKLDVDQVVFAYSDLAHVDVMHKASLALAAGPDFELLGPNRTMLSATVPVISICAVRTGCGKSQVTRWISKYLRTLGLRAAVIRHPMPYGDLVAQAAQRFACRSDLDRADCTVEEREEYEPHLDAGNVVYAGVDYGPILKLAESEADIILWDGGNNDFPFIRTDLQITLVDALRPGHETSYHPGETVLRLADIVLIAKANSAPPDDVEQVRAAVEKTIPHAAIIPIASAVEPDDPAAIKNKRVLVVEDGPTLTHGGMAYGAGYVAAKQVGAREIELSAYRASPAGARLQRRTTGRPCGKSECGRCRSGVISHPLRS